MKKFGKEFNGYNKNEVNAFLDDTIGQIKRLLVKLENEQLEINSLQNQIIHYQDIERSLKLALNSVEESGENIRRTARNEAKGIIDEANRNANRIVNDALIRSERIEVKTENARRNLRLFKNHLRRIVEQQLEVVEEIEILEVEE